MARLTATDDAKSVPPAIQEDVTMDLDILSTDFAVLSVDFANAKWAQLSVLEPLAKAPNGHDVCLESSMHCIICFCVDYSKTKPGERNWKR